MEKSLYGFSIHRNILDEDNYVDMRARADVSPHVSLITAALIKPMFNYIKYSSVSILYFSLSDVYFIPFKAEK